VQNRKTTGIARALSKLGHCSRSRASDLVRSGEVTLNGRVVRDPETPVRIESDKIAVGGRPTESRERVYLVMNKPRGVVTTAADEKGRATVYDLLKSNNSDEKWVAPVGRLDKASEGLLLLTNDSEWAARITDPSSHLDKCYHVHVDCIASEDLLTRIRQGVRSDGERLAVKAVRVVRSGKKNSWLEITLDEGKNRQIRRLLSVLDVEILRLMRISIGSLVLGDLKKGEVRRLTDLERQALDRDLKSTRSQPRRARLV
jgi:23S rRNA pseudouridine2605 synthase